MTATFLILLKSTGSNVPEGGDIGGSHELVFRGFFSPLFVLLHVIFFYGAEFGDCNIFELRKNTAVSNDLPNKNSFTLSLFKLLLSGC